MISQCVISGCAPAGLGQAATSARLLSLHAVPANPGWRSLDEAPEAAVVRPVRVIDISGAVSDPEVLTHPSPGTATTLTYEPGGSAPSMVLDFGQDVGGLPMWDVASASGATMLVAYSEVLDNLGSDGSLSVNAFKSGNPSRTDILSPVGNGPLTGTLPQGGERYERITLTTPGMVSLSSAVIDFAPNRETPTLMKGYFLSDDDLLNRIWYAGAYTLNLNQLVPGTVLQPGTVDQEYLILDGAKRDRGVWSGDQLISDLTDYYVSDPAYARDSLALFLEHPSTDASEFLKAHGTMSQPGPLPGACSPNTIYDVCFSYSASYSMMVVPAVYTYYLYSSDLTFVRRHWPAVVRQMQWDEGQVGSDGLFDVTPVDGADWNVESVGGELTYVNALYVETLRSASLLAAALGHDHQAKRWASGARSVARAVNAMLWDPATGLYDSDTNERGSAVQDANVTAILAEIPDPTRAREILRRLGPQLDTPFGPRNVGDPAPPGYRAIISPYMGGFTVLADFVMGDAPDALSLMAKEWGYMITHDPGGTDWEKIQPDGTLAPGLIADSAAHAWSTGPTAAMSAYVLGIRPTAPGFRRWVIAPQPGTLHFAQGEAPTPYGPISSRWQFGDHSDSFTLTVDAPSRTTGEVDVPLMGHRHAIAMDGRVVWDGHSAAGDAHAHVDGGAIAFEGIAGTHTFAWASASASHRR